MAQSATDETIDELHTVRLAHAARFDFDVARIIDDLRASERSRTEQGWPLVQASPATSSPDRAFQRIRFASHPGNRGKEGSDMKVHYDDEIDALYLSLGDEEPDGVIEIAEGVNLDTTADGKITGIEILRASDRLNLDTILSYTLELDQGIAKRKVA